MMRISKKNYIIIFSTCVLATAFIGLGILYAVLSFLPDNSNQELPVDKETIPFEFSCQTEIENTNTEEQIEYRFYYENDQIKKFKGIKTIKILETSEEKDKEQQKIEEMCKDVTTNFKEEDGIVYQCEEIEDGVKIVTTVLFSTLRNSDGTNEKIQKFRTLEFYSSEEILRLLDQNGYQCEVK